MSGLEDVLMDSGAVAGGSMSGVISGRHYNRDVRSHTLLCEALERLRLDAFMETVPEDEITELQ